MRWLTLIALLALPALADVVPDKPQEKPPEAVVAPPAPAADPAPVAVPAPQHPQGIEKVPMGVIEGGWAYVYAAYGAGLFGLIAYAASLFLRRSSDLPPPGAP
jgi:hypothetical protein